MVRKIARLFTITTKFEAFLVIYGIACGAIERGLHLQHQYGGVGGWMLLTLSPAIVFMAGVRILDSVERASADAT